MNSLWIFFTSIILAWQKLEKQNVRTENKKQTAKQLLLIEILLSLHKVIYDRFNWFESAPNNKKKTHKKWKINQIRQGKWKKLNEQEKEWMKNRQSTYTKSVKTNYKT